MANKKGVKKARELRAQGKTEEQITAALFNMNLREEQVREVISEANEDTSESTEGGTQTEDKKIGKSEKPEKEGKKKWWWPF